MEPSDILVLLAKRVGETYDECPTGVQRLYLDWEERRDQIQRELAMVMQLQCEQSALATEIRRGPR